MIKVKVLYSVAGIATQILLFHKSGDVLVNAGDGVTRDLIAIHYDFYRLRAVLLTHEDFDHISGLYALLNFLKNFYRHRTERLKELLILVPRPVHHLHVMLDVPLMYSELGFPTKLLEVSAGESLSIADLKIRPFVVDHQKLGRVGGPIGGNVGYSVTDREGFKVVLSGDTRPCKTLEQEAKGADIAILEASATDRDLPKAIEHGHMTRSESEKIGRTARKAIYIHKPPKWFV